MNMSLSKHAWLALMSVDCSFVVRYAEEHGRPNATSPWTVRQMGTFLSSDQKQDQHTIVLINPMKRVIKRMKKESMQLPLKLCDVLSLALSTPLHKWPAHLNYLETCCNQLVRSPSRSMSNKTDDIQQTKASVESLTLNMGLKVDLSQADLSTLQRIRRTLQEAIRALKVDLSILNSLQGSHKLSTTQSLPDLMLTRLSNELDRCHVLVLSLNDTTEMVRSPSSALRRSANALQVRTVLERQQSNQASKMAQLAAVDNSVMLELSKKAQRDSRTLKVITILTLLYLPASFVSVSTILPSPSTYVIRL